MIYDESGQRIDNLADEFRRRENYRGRKEESARQTQTITSGFDREVLRLTPRDVDFLKSCGIKVE